MRFVSSAASDKFVPTPGCGIPQASALQGRLQDVCRIGRLIRRHVRYSGLWLGSARRERIRGHLEAMFRVANRMLTEANVPYWITYGTLLGWHRHGALIPGDRDVDFGIREEDAARVWHARHSLPTGYRMFETARHHRGPKLYVTDGAWEADIYPYRERDDMLGSLEISRNPGDTAPFPASYVLPLEEAQFLGERTWRPRQTVAWLEHTYGYIGEDAVRDPRTGYWRPRREA